MTEVILARAREVVEKFPGGNAPAPADIALFIAGANLVVDVLYGYLDPRVRVGR